MSSNEDRESYDQSSLDDIAQVDRQFDWRSGVVRGLPQDRHFALATECFWFVPIHL